MNKKLSQEKIEQLISELLHGEISNNGYIERTHKENKNKNLEFKNWMNSFITVFDKRKVLMAKDEGSYPLLTYLGKFSAKANLKIASELMFKEI